MAWRGERPILVRAICVFLHEDRILAIDGSDPADGRRFWVPVGGRIEFGEAAGEAVAREVMEELGAEVTDLRLLGVVENRFTYDGSPQHEIDFVFDGRFPDESRYGRPQQGLEAHAPFVAHWIDPRHPDGGRPLYPDGLLELVEPELG